MVATTSDYSASGPEILLYTDRVRREEIPTTELATDKELIERFLLGHEDAFAEIARRYRAKMHSIAFCHLRNHSDAEEIAQDTLIRAHRGLARFRGDSSLATWLHSIAFNLSRNRHMYNFRRRRQDTLSLNCPCGEESQDTFGDMIASQAPTPSRSATVDEFSVAWWTGAWTY